MILWGCMNILNCILHLWGDYMGFIDNRIKCCETINEKVIEALFEAAGEMTSTTQRNSRVDTGQTKNSYTYKVDESKGEAYVGSSLENAIWEEFGTGQYALNGDGRKTPWIYQDSKGHWNTTKGKSPNRPLHRAYVSDSSKIKKIFENKLKGIK